MEWISGGNPVVRFTRLGSIFWPVVGTESPLPLAVPFILSVCIELGLAVLGTLLNIEVSKIQDEKRLM